MQIRFLAFLVLIFSWIPSAGATNYRWTGSFDTNAAGNTDPADLAFSTASGTLFVLDGSGATVYEYSTAGSLLTSFSTSAFGANDPSGIAYLPSNNHLYINDVGDDLVYEVTTSGTLVTSYDVSATTNGFTGFTYNSDDGFFYSQGGGLLIIGYTTAFASSGTSFTLSNTVNTPVAHIPQGLEYDAAINNYLMPDDQVSALNFDNIRIVDSTGSYAFESNIGLTGNGAPRGVAIDSDGTAYVSDSTDDEIYIYARQDPFNLDLGCYSIETTTYAFEDISGSGTSILADNDDATTGPIDIGFTFNFYGTDFTQVSWSPNGLMTFGGINGQFGNVNLVTTTTSGNLQSIAVLWDDWKTTAPADSTYYQTLGTSPNRRFVVQWNDVIPFGTSSLDFNVTFEAILYETSNEILFQYKDVDTIAARDKGLSATVGIRDVNGQATWKRTQRSFNQALIESLTAYLLKTYTCSVVSSVASTSDWGWTHRP